MSLTVEMSHTITKFRNQFIGFGGCFHVPDTVGTWEQVQGHTFGRFESWSLPYNKKNEGFVIRHKLQNLCSFKFPYQQKLTQTHFSAFYKVALNIRQRTSKHFFVSMRCLLPDNVANIRMPI